MPPSRPSPELAAIPRAHDTLGLSYQSIAEALRADETTLHRWRRGHSAPSPVFLARLAALASLVDAVERLSLDRDASRRWLDAPVPALDGATAREVLASGRVGILAGVLLAHERLADETSRAPGPYDRRRGGLGALPPMNRTTAAAVAPEGEGARGE